MRSKVFSITYATANLALVVYGMLALFTPNVLLDDFSRNVYEFPKVATQAMAYQAGLFRLLGYFNFLLGALGLWLLSRWLAQREPWLRLSLIAVTGLAYLGPVIFDNTVGHIGIFEVVELVLFVAVVLTGGLELAGRSAQ